MFGRTRRTLATVVALGALGLGGSAIAGAASSSNTTTAAAGSPPAGAPAGAPRGTPGGRPAGRHSANGKTEQALSAADAAKVKAAALAKVPGATVDRVETDVDTGSPYEAHITKSDGSQAVVYVDSSFQATSVASMQHP
ncbi:MAG: hypothetical protein QOG68_2051 [Solirubrobacteraceae bacterium]|jgi:hypothetical protein|nr:hypothetical protein [Solirubrobacteraceae bacterium]